MKNHGIEIYLLTGFYDTIPLIFYDETYQSDISRLLDEYYEEHKNNFPVRLYTYEEVEADEYLSEVSIPLNGGEKYIEGISYIREF